MDKNYRISDIFPTVEQISISYEMEYRGAICVLKKSGTATYKPDFKIDFTFSCINNDCTSDTFDLQNDVSMAIIHKESEVSGIRFCDGQEARDHRNSCPTEMRYTIQVKYRKDSPR